MDRILRPTGFVVIRNHKPVVEFIEKHLTALHWEPVAVQDAEADSYSEENRDSVLIIQKKMWLIDEAGKNESA